MSKTKIKNLNFSSKKKKTLEMENIVKNKKHLIGKIVKKIKDCKYFKNINLSLIS